jgi:hypothetical protein
MTVNGLKLPDAFVALIDRPEPIVRWEPKEGIYYIPQGGTVFLGQVGNERVTAGAQPWEGEDGAFELNLELLDNIEKIEIETSRLPVSFRVATKTPREIASANTMDSHLPGFVRFITDFSRIIIFAVTAAFEPYCFDYRENSDEPGIILWDDSCWRRLSPSFDTFIGLFEPEGSVVQEP